MLNPEKAKEAAQSVRIALAVVGHVEYPLDVAVTCEYCDRNDNCEYSFDLPNTDDNCLAGYSWLTKSVVPS